MPDDSLILGLDLGTQKVAALLGQCGAGQLALRAMGVAVSEGVRRGEIADIEKASAAITRALEKLATNARAADAAGAEGGAASKVPQRAWVGLTGDHVRCYNPRAEITLPRPGRAVSPRDVEHVLREAVHRVSLPGGHEVVHVIARSFAIDDTDPVRSTAAVGEAEIAAGGFRNSITNPVGMPATRLAVQAHVVAASAAALGNLERCVEHAGLAVEGVVLEPVASADAVLTEAERDLGVALLDIGAGTTDIAVFVDGGISFTGALPVGGSHFTRDLSLGLEISMEDAEALKLTRGSALVDAIGRDEAVVIQPLSAEEPKQVPRQLIAEILQPRSVELFSLAKEKMLSSGYFHRLAAGAVLSGGGSLLNDLAPVAKQVLGVPVRLGRPIGRSALDLRDPSFATGIGLLLYGSHEQVQHAAAPWAPARQGIVTRLASWFRHLFG